MREIVLDTETTGLDPADGHRLVEIGCLELENHIATGASFHTYLNPGRTMPEGAQAVHGLSDAFLANKPRFEAVVEDFLTFIGGDPLIIHNASFDLGFLNAELKTAKRDLLPPARAIDTLAIARRKFPGAQNSLDALCRRFGIDNSARTLHGALLDAELLAEVYLELAGGRQPGLGLAAEAAGGVGVSGTPRHEKRQPRPVPLSGLVSDAEAGAHRAFIETLGEAALWKGGR